MLSRNWDKIGPPLRPTAKVAAHMRNQTVDDARVLLLGVTPELHAVFDEIIAVDRDPDMVRNVWPGDTETKTVLVDDWERMKWVPGSFDAIVCDGGFSLLEEQYRIRYLQSMCMEWLRPGGVLVHRFFERPTGRDAITLSDLSIAAGGAKPVNWHAYKWLMAFYLAEARRDSAISLAGLRDMFNDMHRDRQELSDLTGWSMESINTIDFYEGTKKVVFLGTREEHMATIPGSAEDILFWTVDGYDLHEHCPLMRWRKPH